jgi:hypothetical protein
MVQVDPTSIQSRTLDELARNRSSPPTRVTELASHKPSLPPGKSAERQVEAESTKEIMV